MPRIDTPTSPIASPQYASATASSLQRAVDSGDFEQAHAVLDEITARLETNPGSLRRPELRELCLEMPDVIAKAEKADEWSLLQKILGFLALGIPFLVDYLNENEMEKVQRLGHDLQGKLETEKNDLEMFDRYGSSDAFKDALEVTGDTSPNGKNRFAASVMVRLKKKGLIEETAKLSTPLPADVLARVNQDTDFAASSPAISTWSGLLENLSTDVTENGNYDIHALTLQRFIPNSTQQTILNALTANLTANELEVGLAGVGLEAKVLNAQATALTAPKAFGLSGATNMDKAKQQFVLRMGMIFADVNHDGDLNDSDTVTYLNSTGKTETTRYDKLPNELKRLVKFNMATASVCEQYATQPSHQRMRFPAWNSSTGRGAPERVNESVWSVGKTTSGSISWELQSSVTPDVAVRDILGTGSSKYTTECAHGRTMLRLNGLLEYYRTEYGDGEGTFRFNRLFAKDASSRQAAREYIDGFNASKETNPSLSWADYSTETPLPRMEYSLTVSRHNIFGSNETPVSAWNDVTGESAAGNNGYFHNYAVSIEGVNIGYVGENVIDLGFKNGRRRYWGHPGGIQQESQWQHELASGRIPIQTMSDYKQYYSIADQQRSVKAWASRQIDEVEKDIGSLESDKPASWETQVSQKRERIEEWHSMSATLTALFGSIDTAKLGTIQAFLDSSGMMTEPADLKPLVDCYTDKGKSELSAAFEKLPSSKRDALAESLEKDVTELTSEDKALLSIYWHTTRAYGSSFTLANWVEQYTRRAIASPAFAKWVDPSGQFSTPESFKAWLKTQEFADWYETKTGAAWPHATDVSDLTTGQVAELVELALPMVSGRRTIYAEVNRGSQMLSTQMASFLKEGRLPSAEFKPEASTVPLLG
jgi:hypothetical protein